MTIGKMTEADQHLFFQRRIDELESSNRALNAALKSQQASLRDQFAMAALQGLLAHQGQSWSVEHYDADDFAETALNLADAMLKARRPEPEGE